MDPSSHDTVLVLGAGPAGLATCARLRAAGIPFRILEKAEHVAERWRHHYDRLHLHTVKRWSHLPLLPFPDHYPTYVPRLDLIRYFEDYAAHFDISPEFATEVHSIEKAGRVWKVRTNSGELTSTHVIIATGVNNKPRVPDWPGRDLYSGGVMHSIDYRNPQPFTGMRTLVVGMGNTGAEIALDLAEYEVPVWISVRGPVNVVPRDLNGRPVQETGRFLDKFPFGIGQWLGAQVQNLYFGDLGKYGLRRSNLPPAVQLRKTGKTPVIDIGTIAAIKKGKIRVVGEVSAFTSAGVRMKSGDHLEVDQVIFATGYRSCLQDLVEGMDQFLDKMGYPKGPVGTGPFEGMYFVGFDNYKLGGILGTIYADSATVVQAIKDKADFFTQW